jgi:hypothetical protein
MGKYAQARNFVDCDTAAASAAVIIGLRYLGGRGGELKVWCSGGGYARLFVLMENYHVGVGMRVLVLGACACEFMLRFANSRLQVM